MPDQTPKQPGFWQIVLSTIAAAFGVQSQKNQERDFRSGNIYVYITAGIIFTVLFIIIVSLAVKLVLQHHGLS